MIGRLARVGGVALDARFAAARSTHPAELARAAAWIAGNALASQGVRVVLEGLPLDEPAIVGVRVDELAGLLAALARVPALVDVQTIPLHWRAALAGLGVPVLEGRPVDALLRGAAVAVVPPPRRQRRTDAAATVQVHAEPGAYHVRVCRPRRPQLAAA